MLTRIMSYVTHNSIALPDLRAGAASTRGRGGRGARDARAGDLGFEARGTAGIGRMLVDALGAHGFDVLALPQKVDGLDTGRR